MAPKEASDSSDFATYFSRAAIRKSSNSGMHTTAKKPNWEHFGNGMPEEHHLGAGFNERRRSDSAETIQDEGTRGGRRRERDGSHAFGIGSQTCSAPDLKECEKQPLPQLVDRAERFYAKAIENVRGLQSFEGIDPIKTKETLRKLGELLRTIKSMQILLQEHLKEYHREHEITGNERTDEQENRRTLTSSPSLPCIRYLQLLKQTNSALDLQLASEKRLNAHVKQSIQNIESYDKSMLYPTTPKVDASEAKDVQTRWIDDLEKCLKLTLENKRIRSKVLSLMQTTKSFLKDVTNGMVETSL